MLKERPKTETSRFFMDINSLSPQLPNWHLLNGNYRYFKILHQNIRSLRGKHQELLSHLFPNFLHVLCLTEHHLKALELQNINTDHYTIGTQFCITSPAQGGVVIYTHNSLHSAPINLSKYCAEKDIETCAVKLEVLSSVFCIITVYRSPSGNFNHFLETIDAVLQSVYSPSLGIILCGDININYLVVNEQRKQLDNLLLLDNLVGIIDFSTRLTNTSTTAIDNFFIDVSGFHDYVVTPFPNGLSIMTPRYWPLGHCIQDSRQVQN
jgi:exonuclease III